MIFYSVLQETLVNVMRIYVNMTEAVCPGNIDDVYKESDDDSVPSKTIKQNAYQPSFCRSQYCIFIDKIAVEN